MKYKTIKSTHVLREWYVYSKRHKIFLGELDLLNEELNSYEIHGYYLKTLGSFKCKNAKELNFNGRTILKKYSKKPSIQELKDSFPELYI